MLASVPLTFAGLGALFVNLACAFMLPSYCYHSVSLIKAASLSARNDPLANVATIVAGLKTATLWRSAWPDLIVGLCVALINVDAPREVWTTARKQHRTIALPRDCHF